MTTANSITHTFPLTDKSISDAVNLIGEHLETLNIEHKVALRNRLAAEEILLNWQNAQGLSEAFTLDISRRMGRMTLTLRCQGTAVNPLDSDEVFEGAINRQILANLGLGFTWQYQSGVNVASVSQNLPARHSQLTYVLFAAALALVLGSLGLLLPGEWRTGLTNVLIDPLFHTFLGLFSCIVGPMMFIAVVWGMVNIGDTRQLGIIGGKLLTRFLLVSSLFGILCMMATLWCIRPTLGGTQSSVEVLQSIVEMVLGIVPSNIVEPFLTGNTLQILFMGAVVGVVIIMLRERMQVITQLVEQSNAIVQFILSTISSMVPYFIFLSILRLILQGTLAQSAAGLLWAILLTVALSAVEIALETLSLMKLGLSPSRAIKKLGPSFLIALTTASSAAAFPAMMDCCRKELGIDEKLTNFALPFGSVVFMPHAVATFIVVPLFITQIYGIELTVGGLVLCFINAVVLSVAAPPIPGGAVSCFTLMFLQLGIPLEGIPLAVAANVILDFVATAGQLHALIVQLIHGAWNLKLLDKAVLHDEAMHGLKLYTR